MAKMVKTCISNTRAYHIANNIYRVVIPLDDGSSLELLVQQNGYDLTPCDAASRFIYNSISEDFRKTIWGYIASL